MGKFKKGQSGNPNGRPKKGETITDAIREYLKQKNEFDIKDDKGRLLSNKMALVKAAFTMALSGNAMAMQYIINRLDGMPTQNVNMGFEKLEELGNALSEVYTETEDDS